MVSWGPGTGVDKVQAELKRKSAQLDYTEAQLIQLKNELTTLKSTNAELQQGIRQRDTRTNELSNQLTKAQMMLKQREAAMNNLQMQLDASTGSRSRQAATTASAPHTPKGPLSRQDSGEHPGAADEKTQRIQQLEAELAEARRLTPRLMMERSGVAVVGQGGVSTQEANLMRALKAECQMWKDRSESLNMQVKELHKQLQVSEIEKSKLADTAAALSEKNVRMEDQVKSMQSTLVALRATSQQGQVNMWSELQHKDTDLGRLKNQQVSLQDQLDDLREMVDKLTQEKKMMEVNQLQLHEQVNKRTEEVRARAAEISQLKSYLDEKAAALVAAEAEVKEATASRLSMDAYCQDLIAKLTAATKTIEDREAELAEATEKLAAATDAVVELQAQIVADREHIEVSSSSFEVVKQQLEELQIEAEAKQRHLADTVAALDAKQLELDQMQQRMARADENRAALVAKLDVLERQLDQAKDEMTTKSADAAEMATELELAHELAEHKGREAEDAIVQMNACKVAMDRNKENSDREIAELRALVDAKQAHIHSLQAEVDAVRAMASDSEQKLAQMQGLLHLKEDLKQQVEEGQNALKMATAQTESVLADLSATNDELGEQKQQVVALRAAVGEKEKKIDALETELEQQVAARALAERHLREREEVLMDYENSRMGLTVEVSNLKHQLRSFEMTNQDLQREVSEARQELSDREDQVARLESELEMGKQRIETLTAEIEAAPFEADQEIKRQLFDATRRLRETKSMLQQAEDDLQAERIAHRALKDLLEREASQQEMSPLDMGSVGVAASAAAATPADSPTNLSPREAAELRQQVLDMEGELTSMQLADAERQLAQAEAQDKEELAASALQHTEAVH